MLLLLFWEKPEVDFFLFFFFFFSSESGFYLIVLDLAMEMDMEELKNYFQSAPAQITNPEIILNAAFKVEKVSCLVYIS